MHSSTSWTLLGWVGLLLLATGCRPAQQPPPKTTVTINGGTGNDMVVPRGGPSVGFTDTDACAARLQDMIGHFYLYYVAHHRFPDRLSELAQYADFDQVPDYTCPVSHQPYVYVPNGLESPNVAGKLLVFDAVPAHNGHRWGIIVRPPPKRQQTMTMEVIPIPDAVFKTYQPVRVSPQLPPASAPSSGAPAPGQ